MSLYHSINLSLFVFNLYHRGSKSYFICFQLYKHFSDTRNFYLQNFSAPRHSILVIFPITTTQLHFIFLLKIFSDKNLQKQKKISSFFSSSFFSYYINPKVQQFASAANSRAICSIRGL